MRSAERDRLASTSPKKSLPERIPACLGQFGTEGYRVEILTSINDISAAEWNALVGAAGVAKTHAYLAAMEDAAVAGCRYYYPVVRDHAGTIVAHACVYIVTTDFIQLMPAWVATPTRWLRRWWPRLLTARITECACPLVSGSSISHRAGSDRPVTLGLIEQAMQRLARHTGSTCLVLRDFRENEREQLAFLSARGYKRVSNLPLAQMRVRWRTHADYLGAMRSRYRKDLKRRLSRAARDGQRVVVLRDFGADGTRWAAQVAAVHARAAGFKREMVNAAYYANLDHLAGAESLLLVVERDGRRIAHGMVLVDAETTIATFFGREAGPPRGEWFQLMNEAIRIGIERGSRTICLGFGSYDAKGLVGAELIPIEVYARCTNPLLNAVVKLLPDFMRQDTAPSRRVFVD
ncbi:MAG: GNAT family N-acetyltransferase [Gammaproteobacteria bacterium]